MSGLLRQSLVAPEGCVVKDVGLDAGWEAWDRIVSELHAAGVEVRDTSVVSESAYGPAFCFANAHYDDASGIRVHLVSPSMEFTPDGEPVLPEAVA